MSKDLVLVAEAVANEKGVPQDVIFEALEAALASAAKKNFPDPELAPEISLRVSIDRKTGNYRTFRRWEVIADDAPMESPHRQLRLMDAVELRPDAQVGEFVEEEIENVPLGRISAQTAKQVIVQRVRDAERRQVFEAFKDRVGTLVTGTVKRVERGNIYLDLGGNAEAIIPRDKAIPREVVRVGDRLRGYLYDARPEARGPQLFVSRTAPELVKELFRIEVPEVAQGLVEI
ncbi:MAG: transcription termination/antitermination protein NusA, partial [Elioraea sp.]|nr:transcription termination/antitermination protein NusA [Elioraea sp.]